MSKKKKVPHYTDNLFDPFVDDNIHRVVFIFDVTNGKILCPRRGVDALAENLTVKEYDVFESLLNNLYMDMRDYVEEHL